MDQLKHGDVTQKIIDTCFKVYNKLGFGFLENVYERAMIFEMGRNGLVCSRQLPVSVLYEGVNVGNYFADIVVSESVILEIKAANALCEDHERQLINYLKATDIEVGLLLNFGTTPEFKRKVFTNRHS
jgi:GxxExxY protein